MTMVAAHEPMSPELALVSPPEVVREARSTLPAPAWWLARFERELGRAELAAFWFFCVAMTLGPMLLLLALRP